mmetsp:Transcript_21788/g.20917  ORF Transcript_21788/g.20917 Transcript_21788/m.20917 type:complete len:138 (+) Transcript_21788:23-436(+)
MSKLERISKDTFNIASPDLPSDPSDDDCEDVDEMIVISAQTKVKDSRQEINLGEGLTEMAKDEKEKAEIGNHSQISSLTKDSQVSSHQRTSSKDNSRTKSSLFQGNDPEREKDFSVAYKKLAKKLGKEDGGEVLVPT